MIHTACKCFSALFLCVLGLFAFTEAFNTKVWHCEISVIGHRKPKYERKKTQMKNTLDKREPDYVGPCHVSHLFLRGTNTNSSIYDSCTF